MRTEAQDGVRLKEVNSEVLDKCPDSYTAIGFAASADAPKETLSPILELKRRW